MKFLLLNVFFIFSVIFSSTSYAGFETGISVFKNIPLKEKLLNIYTAVQKKTAEVEKTMIPKTGDNYKNIEQAEQAEFNELKIKRIKEACKLIGVPFDVFLAAEMLLAQGDKIFISDQFQKNKTFSNFLLKSQKSTAEELSKAISTLPAKYIVLKGENLESKLYSLLAASAYLEKNSAQRYHVVSLPSSLITNGMDIAKIEAVIFSLESYLKEKMVVHLDTLGGIEAGKPLPPSLLFLDALEKTQKDFRVPFVLNFTQNEVNVFSQTTLYKVAKDKIKEIETKSLSVEQLNDLAKVLLPEIQKKYSTVISERVITSLLKVAPILFPGENIVSSLNQLVKEVVESFTSNKEIELEQVKELVEKKYGKTNLFKTGLAGVDLSNKQEVLKVVLQVQDKVTKELIGQNDAVTKVSQAIEAHYMKKERKTPLSIFAVGLTGVGKTELGNLISKHLYGSNSLANFSLGNFSHVGDLNNLFGSAKGYIGSDEISEFEKFLSKNPSGGVIIFDEASNMGGDKQESKNAMFKRFYELLEEGKWTASKSGVTYNLGNYVFLFTGNDGEKIFKGVNNESYKELLWKENNSREKIFKMLTEVGVPEAFLGRLNEVFLFKPVTKETAIQIAKKFIKDFEKNYEISIKYIDKEKFFNNLVQATFFASEGARSVRNFIENRLGSYIVRASEEALRSGEALKSIKLAWQDNLNARVYAARSFKRQSFLKISISTDKHPKYSAFKSIDVSSDIIQVDLPTRAQVKETAYHEAGHGFLSFAKQTGQKLQFISVIPGRTSAGINYLGVAAYDKDIFTSLTYKNLIKRVAGLLAGGMAEKMAGYNLSSGWSNDLLQVRTIIQHAFLKGTVLEGKGFEFIRIQGKENNVKLSKEQEKRFQEEVEKVIILAKKEVVKTLTKKWSNVEKVVDLLMKKGTINAKEFSTIENDKSIREAWEVDSNLKVYQAASCKSLF
ncbi:MAG: hypothetical protein HAW63_04050 [Bdellovibrionaceae bacterium]|nr:hypothetical protein [Pseudobdellovibrionaceae bacterium]